MSKVIRYFGTITCIFCFMGIAQADPLPEPTVDLTVAGNGGFIGEAYFKQITAFNNGSTGTGVINAFLSIQKDGVEQGYNTDGKVEDEYHMKRTGSPSKADGFTQSLFLSEVPVVIADFDNGEIAYRQFLLDVNENRGGGNEYISLDKLQIYLAGVPDLESFELVNDNPLVYDLDNGGNHWIALNYELNAGSGSGDMFAYIPDSFFASAKERQGLEDPYIYLYSLFGAPKIGENGLKGKDKDKDFFNWGGDAGFEEWAVLGASQRIPPPEVPEPTSLLLLGTGLGIVGLLARNKRK